MSQPLNPLAEADPTSLDLFFDRNPSELTDAQIEVMVVKLREMRVKFLAAEATPKPKRGEKVVLNITDLLE